MTPEEFLRECESMTHHERMRRMVELGQQAIQDVSVRQLLETLAQGDFYPRMLALQSCYGSRDSAHIVQALADPSRRIRSLALKLARLICSDDEIADVLDELPLSMRIFLLRGLSEQHRYTVADTYLTKLAARDDINAKDVLVFASPAAVRRYLAQLPGLLDTRMLTRLAHRYPELAVEHLSGYVSATMDENVDPQLRSLVNGLLPILTPEVPDQVLSLVQLLLPVTPLSHLQLQPLLLLRPREVAALALQSTAVGYLNFNAVVQKLTREQILGLFTRFPVYISTSTLKELSPELRLDIYNVCGRSWRNSQGVLAYDVVAALPQPQRTLEGRRHLALPDLAAAPETRLPYAAFLPWDEAYAVLDTSLRSPDADLRGVAGNALISTVRYQREHLADVLQYVRKRRHEQDPVRYQLLKALGELPHGIWREEHLPDLAQIIRDALDAKDLSYTTAHVIEPLLVHLFPFYPEWSAAQLVIFHREWSNIGFSPLERYVSDAAIPVLVSAMLPLLRSWMQREDANLVVSFAAALGRRLRVADDLLDLLEEIAASTIESSIASRSLSLLTEYLESQRERVSRLIPRLLKQDKSVVVLEPVSDYLNYYRQDLLTPFLGQQRYKGRFATGKVRLIPTFSDGFQCWTPAQQRIYAHALLDFAREKDQDRAVYELIRVVETLALMPALPAETVISFARDERPPVRDAALYALGRLDSGQGIATLLTALNDERARVAIYALRPALLALPTQETLRILRSAPITQVTVAKEVVRLMGELLTEETAFQELLRLEASELHRDVRVALLRALWPYTERDETWQIFIRAAQSPDIAIAQGVVHVPLEGMSDTARKRLVMLMVTLLAHPELEVRMATLRWRKDHPLRDDQQRFFSALLTLIQSSIPAECGQAAATIFASYTGNNAELVGRAIRMILPQRRLLKIALDAYMSTIDWARPRLLATTRSILAALNDDPLTLTFQLSLIVRGLPWDEVVSMLVGLAPRLHADALVHLQELIAGAPRRPDADLAALEQTLKRSEYEGLRRLALSALVAQARSRSGDGWSDERVARLQAYRSDPSPLVAEAAQFTFVV